MEPKSNASLVGRRRGGLSVIMISCCLTCTSPSILASPPFVTDDPEPVDYHRSEFYIGAQQTKSTGGRNGTFPHIEYNYGAAPDVQLHMTIPYAFNNPTSGTTERGIGDTEFGIKYRFIQETENSPMVGTFPILLTHTGNSNKGLVADSVRRPLVKRDRTPSLSRALGWNRRNYPGSRFACPGLGRPAAEKRHDGCTPLWAGCFARQPAAPSYYSPRCCAPSVARSEGWRFGTHSFPA